MNPNLRRFVKTYIKPFWFRMAMVMLMAGVTSSYMFILGFITKMTVDQVLQVRPDSTVVVGSETGLFSLRDKGSPNRSPIE